MAFMARWTGLASALAAGIGLWALSAGPGLAVTLPLFNTREVMASNLAPFPKWNSVMTRYIPGQDLDNGPCQVKTFNRCNLDAWGKVLESARNLPLDQQMDIVNRYMNHATYVTDIQNANYNVEDYWAIPPEFFENDGDCEDYAIAKFISLRALGWSNDDLRIVVLQDLNLRVPHAVLAAYIDGVPYILDNQVDTVIAAERIRHYLPLFSINETNWWLHKP